MIIKPLDQDYQFVELGVTNIEQTLYPPEFVATPEQLFEAAELWHAFWSIVQHTAFSIEQWNEVNKIYTNMLQHLQNSKSQKTKTFYQNIVAWNIVKIWTRYKAIATEVPLYLRIEAWKYLIFIKSWGFDMLGKAEDWKTIVYDNKLYSKYFSDYNKNNLWTIYKNSDKEQEILTKPYSWPVYTVQEILQTDLWKKIQWRMYPLMVWIEDWDYMYFQYNVAVKNEAKTKNIMPNIQEIRIKVTKEDAEQLLRNAMVNIFKFHFDKEKNCLIDSKN